MADAAFAQRRKTIRNSLRAVLGVVKEKSLFFLDSRTTGASVVGTEAALLHVPFLARDVFLDDVAAETAAKGGVPEALDSAWERARDVSGMREMALLRAIGATQRQVLASVIGESVVVGVLASAIGVGIGVLLSIGLKALMNAIGFETEPFGNRTIAVKAAPAVVSIARNRAPFCTIGSGDVM